MTSSLRASMGEGVFARALSAVGNTAREIGSAIARLGARGNAAAETTNGAAIVRMGQAGEAAVRAVYNIGAKATRVIGGRTRIFDGLNASAVSEVKNVRYQAFTQQLKDSLAYAQANGLQFDLYVRGGANPTILSKALKYAIDNTPDFNLRSIP